MSDAPSPEPVSPHPASGGETDVPAQRDFKSVRERNEVRLRAIPYGFAALIGVGALLLALPFAHNPGQHVPFLDALFLSTSACCVTGLVTVNVADTFNWFGQGVLLVLIQLGGIGIMTAGTLFLLFTGNRLSLAHERSIESTFGTLRSARPIDVLIYACAFVLIFELAGVVSMFSLINQYWPNQSVGESLWQAVFHSVSAFCNAGISILPNGLEQWRDHASLLLIISLLVVGGGIGLLTLVNLRYFYWWRRDTRRRGRLTLQSRLSIVMALLLLAVGTLATLGLEWNKTLAGASFEDKVSWSFFHSAMTRTAGFNVVDNGQMTPATLEVTMALMFIGGSPGSMAGGIKTVTAVLLFMTAWMSLRRREEISILGRRVPRDATSAAVMLTLLAIICLLIAVTLLMITEYNHPASQTPNGWLAVVFEAVSAFGTVGLSAGVTPLLTAWGKVIIVLVMFLGRVGPLMLAVHLCRPVSPWHVRYPEESVSVG